MKFLVFGAVIGAVVIFELTYWCGATGSTLLSDLGTLEDAPLTAAAGLVCVGSRASAAPGRAPGRGLPGASLSEGSRRAMRTSLENIARFLSNGEADAFGLAWHELRYQHTALAR